jgi:signal transduction histidine kinase
VAVERPLRARLQLAITAGVLLFGVLNVVLVGRITYGALRGEQDRRLTFVALLLAQRAARPMLVEDLLDLQKLLEEARTLDKDLAYVTVFDRHGAQVAQSASGEALAALPARRQEPGEGPARYREVVEPIMDGKLGEVHVGVDEAGLRQTLFRIVGVIATMVLGFLLVGVAAAALVARTVTRPLERLVEFAANVRLEGPLPSLSLGGRDEIAELGHHFEESAAQLQRLHGEARGRDRELARVEHLAVVGTLAAGVAHEINNPLAGLRTALERLLRLVRDPADAERYGTVLRDAIARIERTVQGVLRFARATEVHVGPVRLEGAVERALELAGPRLEDGRIGLVREIPPDLPAVSADGTILTHVILNVILNACDAMPDGGEIVLGAGLEQDAAVLVISDSGPGIPPDIAPKIFDPFFTTKPPGKGTGLGLAVSQAGIREAGGDLELISTGRPGASFRIRLPLAKGGRHGADPAG